MFKLNILIDIDTFFNLKQASRANAFKGEEDFYHELHEIGSMVNAYSLGSIVPKFNSTLPPNNNPIDSLTLNRTSHRLHYNRASHGVIPAYCKSSLVNVFTDHY
ncbi:hypothetical protein U3516DRAFT_756363 [Neocallimastix sp. 'constans']